MAEPSYAYRPHALTSERLYTLRPEGLVWSTSRGNGVVAYRDIKQVRIFKARRFGSSATYWNCVLRPRSGRTIRLGAANRVGFNTIEDRTSAYIPFIQELEARVAAANPGLQVEMSRHWLSKVDAATGQAVVWLLRGIRGFSLERSADIAAWGLRKIGPRLRGHRVAREQIAMAYPDMPPAEVERLLSGMWDNLARIGAEYAHLDRLWDFDLDRPDQGRIVADEAVAATCRRLKSERGPVLMFGAHLSNWEVAGLAGRILAPHMTMIYKAPRIGAVADEMQKLRSTSGATLVAADATAAIKISQALKRRNAVAMLVDEYYPNGVEVTMFSRPFRINPLFARLVRMFDCPFHGFRTVRLPGSRFRLDITPAIEPPRDTRGRVDVAGTMQAVASTIEGWIREHPEQWLWLHRHWR